ncbi:sugar transferase [Enterococcus faecium]|nr:sugar transferase [Enterococcus faecium]EGP5210551.1 sugar transferase [Enterococcus faecium]EGP5624998.1 sugar transferase [Enterococcus faecium]EME3521778.1 sugar transferase [Enterococcus faecium]EMF0348998.1 sugar transferase [Enterococcus faecium]
MYAKFVKRFLDFILSLFAIILLSPFLLILLILGSIYMRGNPFFFQERPGKNEKVFRIIKFRSMNNKKDRNGNLLPDEVRLNKYGKFLRNTSLDELPELFNILKGDMSIIGPRPLLVDYLPFYKPNEKIRYKMRPGLSGLAQVSGRNFLSWEEIFEYDIEYVNNVSFKLDVQILFKTVRRVAKKDSIADVSTLNIDEDGELYVLVENKKKRLHKPLNIERRGMNNAKGNRK